ncbi:F0F1 ATP synthase subunit alpha [Candidatus Saccharibacteria bacterium]|nr:F0F1 ATP synthase subunit alpha [Candidatus Saccharibacteria bacterium]HPG37274.1 F0F1 ATP synthase subunit alpha [Candidatus Saccharibacteria bacterium]
MAETSIKDLSADIRAAIAELKSRPEIESVGIVTKVGDGVAWIYGLRNCKFNEMLDIEGADGKTVTAFALNLGEEEIGAVLMGNETGIKAGAKARLSGRVLEVPVGPELVGRVVDPLGRPLDGGDPIKTKQMSPVEKVAPGVLDRKHVHEPMMTGIAAIDAMVPIGRGQRELIIGDRQTGKTAIAVDTMINQHRQNTGVINIYVAIGQKASKVATLVERLKREGVMDQTIVVATSPADSAALLYLAPYAGAAMGEYFRDNKQHALIIYDDLTKHAAAYRQMSLLLRRPPGREAYPGDVFYLHSRLLERAAKLSDDLGAGSLTALPIIETQAGDISAYIPTNVISITDGQIFMETSLFYQGIRPAISVGLSVSRVGGDAQTKAVKSVAGTLRLDLAQFRELAAFSQFSTDLDAETRQRIERGQRLTELLKQPQYSPYSVWEMYSILLAATQGAFDKVPLEKVKTMADGLLRELKTKHDKLVKLVNTGNKPTDDDNKVILDVAKSLAKAYEVKEEK